MDSRNNLSNVYNLLKLVKETWHGKISDTESQRKGGRGDASPPPFPGAKNFFHVKLEKTNFCKIFTCE